MDQVGDHEKATRKDAERLLEEAMKQPGVKEALEVNQAYQNLLDRADLSGASMQYVRVINATRTG
jgi:hypothetical protein